MDAREVLAEAWKEEKVPILNGVIYPDGRWFRFEATDDGVAVTETRWDTLDMQDEWTCFASFYHTSIPNETLELTAGEGGLGSDGVIVLVDSSNSTPVWVLFLDWSNPFSHLEIESGKIIARTTLDTVWTIDLSSPENVSKLSVITDKKG